MKKKIEKFEGFQLKQDELKQVKGGDPASPYICAALGYTVGTYGFEGCLSTFDALFVGLQYI